PAQAGAVTELTQPAATPADDLLVPVAQAEVVVAAGDLHDRAGEHHGGGRHGFADAVAGVGAVDVAPAPERTVTTDGARRARPARERGEGAAIVGLVRLPHVEEVTGA